MSSGALPGFAAAALLAALSFALAGDARYAAHLHVLLAGGVMPLIFAAMLHFVPVLTRSAAAPRGLLAIPLLGLAGGAGAVATLAGAPLPLPLAPLPAVGAALWLLAWSSRRRAACVGPAHPGVDWYRWALLCLLFALAAVPVMTLWPEHWMALRRLHLHLNLLGFIGLTAIGTLQVLIPTLSGRADPGTAARLRSDLCPAVAGTLLLAAGAAGAQPLTFAGGLLWLWPLIRWLRTLARQRSALGGAALPLAGAALGYTALVLHGLLHSTGLVSAPPALAAFFAWCLFPLLSGALAHLLPLWLWPGLPGDAHLAQRARLVRGQGLRLALFALAGALALAAVPLALLPAAPALLDFAIRALGLRHARP